MHKWLGIDLSSPFGRALVEERYWSLRRQIPIVYLLGFVNLSGMELATAGKLSVGLNPPTFIALCAMVRMAQWFGASRHISHERMVRRLRQTVWFAAIVCVAVCARCLDLMQSGDPTAGMAALLFGGLTAIGVAYGLTAMPFAGRIPLVLIVVPLTGATFLSTDTHFVWAAFALVVVAALTMRLLDAHSRHFTDLVRSRSAIAHERQLAETAHEEAVLAATTDFLTGLPNRRAFVAALDSELSKTDGGSSFAVAILDLDRFKAINDTFGHAAGDKLLQEVAARLVRAVASVGLVARLGGDEFGVLLPGIGRAADAHLIGTHILSEVNRPVAIEEREFNVSACCGMGISRRGKDRSPSRAIADADLALYQAKEDPAHDVAVFEVRMEAPRRRRSQIERALRAPGVNEKFDLAFQPIVCLNSGTVIAHEALARWTDAELGTVGPAEFVPIAEQLNLIDGITSHLMTKAFQTARMWQNGVRLSFNLSAVQLCSPGSAKTVLRALSAVGLDPERLQVEVTETALLVDFQAARKNLTQLREAGVTIVLDDFGAGYASIGYLRELSFDQIKLDGALVTAAQHNADGKRLLRAVVRLCEVLGVSTIAEHVESEELMRLVIDLGCNAGQGFWLQRPVSAEHIKDLAVIRAKARQLVEAGPNRRAA